MTTSLVLPDGTPPEGARTLGIRNAPSLRLSIGFRNPARGNAPDKLDYFRAKEGANKEFAAAARKFHDPDQGYGPQPRAIDIRLPARIEDAIRIEYLAFKGNRDDPAGGVMIARGHTNFAPLGYCGGPDTLTVWHEDGRVEQVATKGVDAVTKQALDTTASELGLMLCTTFCVGLPKILGFGSHAEITSKSLKSTDQVWHKLRALYEAFPNGAITFATKPLLVVKPAHARPMVKMKDGTTRRIRSLVYVLDVVQPESEDEMIARLEKYHGAVAGGIEQRAPVGEIEVAPGVHATPPENVAEMVEDITDAEIVEDSESDPTGTPLSPEQSGSEQHPSDERAVSQTPEEGPRSPTPETGGSDAEAPGMGARTPEPPELDAGASTLRQEPIGVEQDDIPPLASGESSQQADGEKTPAPEAPGDIGPEPALEDPVLAPVADAVTSEDIAAAEAAARVKPPFGSHQTRSLAAILKNPTGKDWFEWTVKFSASGGFKPQDAKFERALWAFVKVNLPELYEAHKDAAK